MNGLSGTPLPHEPHSKQIARQIIAWVLMLFAPVNAALFGVLIGKSLLTGAFRSGQNHARQRYIDNLGLIPLRTQHDWQIEQQTRLFSRQRRSALFTGEELASTIVLALTVGTGTFISSGASTAFLSVIFVMLALPALQVAAWFATHPDPIGHIWKRSSKPRFGVAAGRNLRNGGLWATNSISMTSLKSQIAGKDASGKDKDERRSASAPPAFPENE